MPATALGYQSSREWSCGLSVFVRKQLRIPSRALRPFNGASSVELLFTELMDAVVPHQARSRPTSASMVVDRAEAMVCRIGNAVSVAGCLGAGHTICAVQKVAIGYDMSSDCAETTAAGGSYVDR